MDSLPGNALLNDALPAAWERLARQHLLDDGAAALSLRVPGQDALLALGAASRAPTRHALAALAAGSDPELALHAGIFQLRADVGAVATGIGSFAPELCTVQGTMPALFDEQARHLGRIPTAAARGDRDSLRAVLGEGDNIAFVGGRTVCLGVNCARLVLNIELFEKCAKAYVLALASGGQVRRLPWWVQRITKGRLLRDERRAAGRFAQGQLPEEARGY